MAGYTALYDSCVLNPAPLRDLLMQLSLSASKKLAGQKQIKAFGSQRSEKRRSLFEAQDKVDLQREDLIAEASLSLLTKEKP
jgi:hypothetical protein